MKLVAIAALLFTVSAAAPVRYESNGIRVGHELVSGTALELKSVDASTLLVSSSSVENLGAPVEIALDANHALSLQPGLRLERRADGFVLASHGPALVVAGLSLNGAASLAFTLTAKGFDFGALGSVEGSTFSVRTATEGPQQQGPVVSPERRLSSPRGRAASMKHRAFRGGNPFVPGAGADREILSSLQQVSLDGSN